MTRHDEPAEGDVAEVAEVLAIHTQTHSGWCTCGWQSEPSTHLGTNLQWNAHLTDALRDLLATAEQRGRVAALREAGEAVKAESVNAHDYRRNRGKDIWGLTVARRIIRDQITTTERAQ